MTTDNPTVHDRVVQAFQRDAELLGQLKVLVDAVQVAKSSEDALRKSEPLKRETDKLAAERDGVIAAATSMRDAPVARAQSLLDEAQAKRDAAVTKEELLLNKAKAAYQDVVDATQAELDIVRQEAIAEYNVRLVEVTRAAELEAAEARATVHHAEQEMESHRATLNQHRRNVKDRLGISIDNLVG